MFARWDDDPSCLSCGFVLYDPREQELVRQIAAEDEKYRLTKQRRRGPKTGSIAL